ncbi:hypothetical protein LTS02_016415 [Friedmanniomyces endolithicus]|nr:hypothetical protein LTS02_016415 [Friedmanniomyces endolithicus]KAK0864565.1 hypothetical protein LTR87_015742 [Friedmanniomyces endolithicus]
MSATPIHDIWEASSSQPFLPSIPKGLQFPIAFTLLFIAVLLTGLFGLSMLIQLRQCQTRADLPTDNTLKNLPLYGIPASLAFAFGAVYMICAVGVYV